MSRQLVNNNLVYNGDFEIAPSTNVAQTAGNLNWINGTSSGSSTNSLYGWSIYVSNSSANGTAQFDNSTSHSGNWSIKITNLVAANYVILYSAKYNSKSTINNYWIAVQPNTSYDLSWWMSTSLNTSGTGGANMNIYEYYGNFTLATTHTYGTTNTSTGWTQYTGQFTTGSTTRYVLVLPSVGNSSGTLTMSAWFDDIQLYPTIINTRTQTNTRLVQQNTNSSLFFNGSSGYLTNSVVPATTGFCCALWIKCVKGLEGFIDMFVAYNSAGSTDGFRIGQTTTDGSINLLIYNSTTTILNITANNFKKGNWNHLAFSYLPSGTCTVWVNATPTTGTSTGTMTSAGVPIYFGRRSYTPIFITGFMSNIVWQNTTTSWTQQQVNQLYTQGIIPPNPTVYLPLNEGAGSIAYDISGNGNNGTITAGTYSSDVPFKTRKLVNDNLVYNGDFEIAPVVNSSSNAVSHQWLDGTVNGSGTNALFGWAYFNWTGSHTAYFDNAISKSGGYSLHIATTAVASTLGIGINNGTAALHRQNNIPCFPNTKYTVTFWMKTTVNSGAATTGAYMRVCSTLGDGTTIVDNLVSTNVNTTTSWTQYTVNLTTAISARYIWLDCQLTANDGAGTLIMDAWFDDIVLVPTITPTRTLIV